MALFHEVADAVGTAIARQTDWGESGGRAGQYAVDLVVDAACTDRLLGAGFAVLSEESGVQGAAGVPTVVVDPLDGSTNASRGIPWFATALCLVDAVGPAVSMVANHATGERFTAVRGGGAHRDGRPLAVSACMELGDAIVGVSGLPTHHYGWSQFRALGAASPDICAVASGTLDAWVDMSDDAHGVWDYLAAISILREAGGVAVDVFDRELVTLDHAARRTPIGAATSQLCDVLVAARR
jgi:myo-inositol-1(or 4)-monophosphatase